MTGQQFFFTYSMVSVYQAFVVVFQKIWKYSDNMNTNNCKRIKEMYNILEWWTLQVVYKIFQQSQIP